MTPKGMFDPSADAVAFGVLKERSAHVSRRVGVEGRPGSYLRVEQPPRLHPARIVQPFPLRITISTRKFPLK